MRSKIIFQQDGAPPNYERNVRKFLDDVFPNRWIGRCGPMTWASRSPDLTPLDFFVWGFLKNEVYKGKITDLDDLQKINCIKKINLDMCTNAVQSFRDRLLLCIENDGGYVE